MIGLMDTVESLDYDVPKAWRYVQGRLPANYPVPATIGRVQTTRYGCYFIKPDWIGTTLTINWLSEWHWD